jgi:uncharacterized protein
VDAVLPDLLPDSLEVGVVVVNAGTLLGRGISFPPRVGGDGRVAWSEGEQNIREAIQVILETELSERLRLPRFGGGLESLLFDPNTTATRTEVQDRIVKALAAWEPRVTVGSVRVDEDPDDPEAAVATIEYSLVATQAPARTTLRVPLAG